MAIETLPGVEQIHDEYAAIAFGNKLTGNVDTREIHGDPEVSFANRQEFLRRTLAPAHYVLQRVALEPTFTDLSDIATENLASTYTTDGLFINRPGVALGLNTADCNAITMYDGTRGRALGLIHAGRQGVMGGIHQAALNHLTGPHEVPIKDVRIHIAPSVRVDSYRFPCISQSVLADPKWQRMVTEYDDGFHLDVLNPILSDFADAGVNPAHITVSSIDTGADESYFSHSRGVRSGEAPGRNAVAAMLHAQGDQL